MSRLLLDMRLDITSLIRWFNVYVSSHYTKLPFHLSLIVHFFLDLYHNIIFFISTIITKIKIVVFHPNLNIYCFYVYTRNIIFIQFADIFIMLCNIILYTVYN